METVKRHETLATLVQRAGTMSTDAASGPEPFGRPRFLAPADALRVRYGFVDLFWVELRDGVISGARRHIVRIAAGGVVLGTPIVAQSGVPSGALLAVGGLDAEITAQPSADLIASGAQNAATVDAWLAGLSQAAWPRPVGDRHSIARPGQTLELAPGDVIRAAPRSVAWLGVTRGALASEGIAGARPLGPEDGILPVTEETGAIAHGVALVECCDTATALARGGPDIGGAIARFNERAMAQLAARFVEADRATVARRAAGGRSAEREFLADFAQLAVAAGSQHVAPRGAEIGAEDPAAAAVRLVAEAQSIALPALPRGQDDPATPFERVSRLADAADLRYRRVVLRGRWWRGDHGPMVGFRGTGQTPVALLATPGSRYRMVDPSRGEALALDAALRGELSGEAVILYRPLPHGAVTWRRLVGFAGLGSARDALTVVLASLAVALLALVVPLATGLVFDTVIPNAERTLLIELVGGLVAVAVGGALFEAARAIALVRIEGRIEWVLQSAVVDRLLSLPASFFKSYSSGDLADRLLGIDAMRQALTGTAVTSLIAIVFSLANVILLFLIEARLAIVAVGLLAVSVGLTVLFSLGQLHHQRARIDRRGKLGGFVNQLIIGVSKLRIAAREQRAAGVWAREAALLTAETIKARRYEALLQVLLEAFPAIATAIVFLGVVTLLPDAGASHGGLSVGRFLAFISAFGQLLAALSALALALTQCLIAIPLYERAHPILAATPEEREPGAAQLRLDGGIEIERLSFRYGDNEPSVLDDISFAVAPGEFVAVVGPSGSGKSTLLRLILGFEKSESGTILFDGRPIESLDLAALRRDMGVVLQNGKLSPGSIYENIVGHTGLTLDDAWQTARLVGLDGDIEAMPMGMHTVLMEGGGTLSGGQRQRLMIARALVRRPRILLLDEATSALDNRTQATVTASLAQLNVTRLVIAHRLSTIQSADRIIVLERGRIVESGPYSTLIAKDGAFAALARRQLL